MALLGVDISSITGSQPCEMLLLSSGSSDPNSTLVVDPRTGVSSWSYKGSELQGASTGFVEPLGKSGEHIIITTKERPLVHVLAVHNKDRFHHKAVLPGPVSAICSDKNGRLVFMAIKKQIFCWLLSTGELLSVTDAHYQNITMLALSDDDSMLFSSSKDGAIHAYLVTELLSADRDHTVTPFRKWSSHTLSVSCLQVSKGSNPRVLSSGLDHIACIHSVSLDSFILKISSDRPLTSCCMDSAETRVFVGTDVGGIAQVNLFQLGSERDLLIQTSDEHNTKFRVLNNHSDEIKKLAVNSDGTLLASGDSSGKYCIWEISSHQCLKVSTMRASITTLRFIPYWSTISSVDQKTHWRPIWELKREPTKCDNLLLEAPVDKDDEMDDLNMMTEVYDHFIAGMVGEQKINLGALKKAEKAEKAAQEQKVIAIKDDDEEEGAPEIGETRSSRKKKNKKKNKNAQSAQSSANNTLQNIEIEEIVIDDDEESNVSSSKVRELLKKVDSLTKERDNLKEVNKQMYEFMAKEIVGNNDDDD